MTTEVRWIWLLTILFLMFGFYVSGHEPELSREEAIEVLLGPPVTFTTRRVAAIDLLSR